MSISQAHARPQFANAMELHPRPFAGQNKAPNRSGASGL